jgi:hypothetical protein
MNKFSTAVLLVGVVLNPIQEIWAVKRGASDSRQLRAAVSWNAILMIAALLFTIP